MFLVELNYIRSLAEIEQHLPAHRAFLDKYYQQGRFIVSGRKSPRTGGFILVKHGSEAEVRQLFTEDPFWVYNLADYYIQEFIPTKYAPDFAAFISGVAPEKIELATNPAEYK